MRYSARSHCAGGDVIPAYIQQEIAHAIGNAELKIGPRAATRIRNTILSSLKASGWTGKVSVAQGSDITISSIRNDVGLCLQTGNMARMYADLIKLQTLYLDNVIKSAVIIVPSEPVALSLGSNIAQARRLERELDIFKKAYHVPTIIYALE